MPSPLITDVTSQGLQLRPIQGPGVRAQTQVAIGPLDPRYPMAANAAVFDALRLKEQQHQFDQQLSLQLQESQRKLFKDMFGQSIQSAQVAGENYGLDPMLNSHALKLQQIKQKEQEAMTNIQNAFSAATSRSGRPSATGYMDQINRTANALQQDLLSDQEYAQMALQNRRKTDFLKQVAALEKQGYNINYADVNQAVESYYNSANDLSGQTIFNANAFDPQQYIFDKDQADKALEEYLTGAIGETELERVISAVELDPALEGVNAYVTVNETVRNELDKASSLAANAILADSNLIKSMRAGQYDTTRAGIEAYVKAVLEDRLAKRDIERSYTNLGDVNTALRAQQSAQYRMDLEELQAQNRLELEREKQRTKSTESTVNIRGNRGKIDREKEPELADFIDYVDSQVDSQWTVSNQQSRDLKADLENLGIPASNADIKVQDDGTLTLSYQNKAGDVKTKTYGKASKRTQTKVTRDPKLSDTYTSDFGVPDLKLEDLTLDGTVLPLLEVISSGEGTTDAKAKSMGFDSGYDVTLGYGKFDPKGYKPVSQLTLGEIDKFQTEMLDHPENSFPIGDGTYKPSSAVGKYQIVRTNLRKIKEELGLTDDMVFTPELQDKIGRYLLERRGLSKFMEGDISQEDFQLSLAKEWASIADPATGKSYYGQATGTGSDILDPIFSSLNANAPSSNTPTSVAESKPEPLTFTEAMVAAPQEISPDDYYNRLSEDRPNRSWATSVYLGLNENSISIIENYGKAKEELKKAEDSFEGIKEAQVNLDLAAKALREDPTIKRQLILRSSKDEDIKSAGVSLAETMLRDEEEMGITKPLIKGDGTMAVVDIYNLSDGRIGVRFYNQGGTNEDKKFKDRTEFGEYIAENYTGSVADNLTNDLQVSAEKKLGMPKEAIQSDGLQGTTLDEIKKKRAARGGAGTKANPTPNEPSPTTTPRGSESAGLLQEYLADGEEVYVTSNADGKIYKLSLRPDPNSLGTQIVLSPDGGEGKEIVESFSDRASATVFLNNKYKLAN